MSFSRERKEIIVKMVSAVMREAFSRLARRYGQEKAFQAWVEYAKRRSGNTQTLEERLKPDMSLAQTLEIIGEFTRPLERSIHERLEKEGKNQA